MESKLPVINSLENISTEQLDSLMRIGFTYVKLPESGLNDLQILAEKSRLFFQQAETEKQKIPINSRFEGYVNHQNEVTPQSAQNLIFSIKNPLGPFADDKAFITRLGNFLQNEIAFPLIKKIFERAHLAEHYANTVQDSYSAFTLVYYPKAAELEKECNLGLNGHEDWDLMTALFITEPGLEVLVGGHWESVLPKPGYLVVNLANALELMLGKRCTSALHRVRLIKNDRLAVGLFVGPNEYAPLKDYTTNTVKYNSFFEYLTQKIKVENLSILDSLLSKAKEAMANAYIAYSHFPVGACILADDGKIYSGCNVGNACHALSQCAESTAIGNMITHGSKKISKIVIVSKSERPISPCGACRQKILEFAIHDTAVYMFNLNNDSIILFANELLPQAFSPSHLKVIEES